MSDDWLDITPDWFTYHDGGRSTSRRPKQRNDCVVRAIAITTGLDYDTVYDRLARAGRRSGQGTDAEITKAMARLYGWAWTPFPAVKGKPRMRPDRFCAEHPDGRWILREARHLAAVIDGKYHGLHLPYDSRCIYGAWQIHEMAHLP